MIPNDLYIWKLICCVFLNKREVLSRFFEKSYIFKYFSTCLTRSDDFWILNAMCMFIYLFVVYFSFAPVISAITHRYCELFYIQVLMMVIITETLTSTSHHDIFTYLDYIFSCYLHIYIYIYIYISWPTFSLAATPRCRAGLNSFPWIGPRYSWPLTYNAEY